MTVPTTLGDRLLVLFDGHCGLCNRTVRWLLVHDRHDRLRFTPSNCAIGEQVMARHGLNFEPPANPNSVLVVEATGTPAERLLTRSDAVLALLAQLPAPWPAVAAMSRIMPRVFRDLAYRFIARYRYRIWGRLDACPIPTAEERRHFL
jgi:predicted DCC family thiol-disulfide oxidoreductase YuxK